MFTQIVAVLQRGGLAVALCCVCSTMRAEVAAGAWELPAPPAIKPEQSVVLHLTLAGKRLIAVGERGLAMYSDDDGRHWAQAPVPVSVTLTRAVFLTSHAGWAVGHGGVILRSDDGGQSWRKQLDGVQAARLASAKYASESNDQVSRALARMAGQLVSDGADKPFFDILFVDQRTGFAIGAYGLVFHTTDGGTNWLPWMEHIDNPQGLHLYGMVRDGAILFIAGEQGLLLRSTDGGQHFLRVASPYQGSYFGMLAAPGGGLYLYGLRGSLYRSTDHGSAWTKLTTNSTASFSAAYALGVGGAFANQSGQIFTDGAGGVSLHLVPSIAPAPYTSLIRSADGAWILASMRGLSRLEPGRAAAVTLNEINQ